MTRILVLAVVLLVAPAHAGTPCYEDSWLTVHRADTGETLAGRYYADIDRTCQIECAPNFPSVWLYQESNGIEGLQRQDVNRDDTCGDAIEPDTLVF